MGRHVAGNAGINVFPPGAADLIGLFIDRETVDPFLAEANSHAKARKARPKNRKTRRFAAGAMVFIKRHGDLLRLNWSVYQPPRRLLFSAQNSRHYAQTQPIRTQSRLWRRPRRIS